MFQVHGDYTKHMLVYILRNLGLVSRETHHSADWSIKRQANQRQIDRKPDEYGFLYGRREKGEFP